MTKIKITVIKKFNPKDVFGHDIAHPKGGVIPTCYVFDEGEEFIIENLKQPEKFCGWGWKTVLKDLKILDSGDDVSWTEPGIIYTCCTDGARPVCFKLERINVQVINIPSNVKITVIKQFLPKDIFGHDFTLVSGEKVINCSLKEGEEFFSEGTGNMPEGFCPQAWNSIFRNVHLLTWGGGYSETIGDNIAFGVCPDGLRPVIFKLERIET